MNKNNYISCRNTENMVALEKENDKQIMLT